MRDDAIRAYMAAPNISAEAELAALGDDFAEAVLVFCADVVSGRIDHWTLLPFYEKHRSIPVYKYADAERCALVAVEDDGSGDRMVSIILATRTGARMLIDGRVWDGIEMNALRMNFLLPRLLDYFP